MPSTENSHYASEKTGYVILWQMAAYSILIPHLSEQATFIN